MEVMAKRRQAKPLLWEDSWQIRNAKCPYKERKVRISSIHTIHELYFLYIVDII
jgi:SET domain-containing protein